tara:strand:+ start:20103 stop:25748 length:5646 start_codon:yes stop_codon:yes gene_type:complete
MDYITIARKIKSQFPAYRNMDDIELATKAIANNPSITNGLTVTRTPITKNLDIANNLLNSNPLDNLPKDRKEMYSNILSEEDIEKTKTKNYYDYKFGLDHNDAELKQRVEFEYGKDVNFKSVNNENSVRLNNSNAIKPVTFGEVNSYSKTHSSTDVELSGFELKDKDIVQEGTRQVVQDQIDGVYSESKDYTSSIMNSVSMKEAFAPFDFGRKKIFSSNANLIKRNFNIFEGWFNNFFKQTTDKDYKSFIKNQAETGWTGIKEQYATGVLALFETAENIGKRLGFSTYTSEKITNDVFDLMYRFTPVGMKELREKGTDYKPITKEEYVDMKVSMNLLGQSLIEQGAEISKDMVPDVDGFELFKKSFTKDFTEEDGLVFGEWIGGMIAQQFPQLFVQIGLTALVGLATRNPKAAAATGSVFMGINATAQSQAALDSDLNKPFEDLTRPVIDGVIEALSEKFELDVIIKPFTKKAIKGGLKRYVLNVGKTVATGAGSEGLAQVGQNVNAKMFGDDISITSGLGEAALLGGIIDGQIGTATQLYSIKRTKAIKNKDKKSVKEYNDTATNLSEKIKQNVANKIVFGYRNNEHIAVEYDNNGNMVNILRVADDNDLAELDFKRQLIAFQKETEKDLFLFEETKDGNIDLTYQIYETEDMISYEVPKRAVKLGFREGKTGRMDLEPLYQKSSSTKNGGKKLGNLNRNLNTILKTFPNNSRANTIKNIFLKFKKYYPNTLAASNLYGFRRMSGAAGSYMPFSKDIHLDMKTGNTPKTLLHETVHAITEPALQAEIDAISDTFPEARHLLSTRLTGQKLYNLMKEMSEKYPELQVGQLCKLMVIVIEHQGLESFLANRKVSGYGFWGSVKPQGLKYNTDLPYGLSAMFEFVTEAFSEPSFQRELESIKLPNDPNTSVWSKFTELISKLFGRIGLTKKENNVLMESISLIESIGETTEQIITSENLKSKKYKVPIKSELEILTDETRVKENKARRKRLAQTTELSNLREAYENLSMDELVNRLNELGVEKDSLLNKAIREDDAYYVTSVILKNELGDIADINERKRYRQPQFTADEIKNELIEQSEKGELRRLSAGYYFINVFTDKEGNHFIVPQEINTLKKSLSWKKTNKDAKPNSLIFKDNYYFNKEVEKQFKERRSKIEERKLEADLETPPFEQEEFIEKLENRIQGIKNAIFFFLPRNLSSRIRELSPKIYIRLMEMHQQERVMLIEYKRTFEPFRLAVKKARRKLSVQERKEFNAAILNGDWKTVKKFGVPQETIDIAINLFGDIADKLGMDRNRKYFRRVVSDYEGLVKALAKKPNSDIEAAIKSWIKAKKRRPNKKQLESIIRSFLRNNKNYEATLQTRSVAEVTPELSQYYADPVTYLDAYFARVARLYSRATAFGVPLKSRKRKVTLQDEDGNDIVIGTVDELEADTDFDNNIVELIIKQLVESKTVNDVKKIDKLVDLLKSALNYKASSKPIQSFRTLASTKFVVQIDTFLLQLVDIPISIIYNGLGSVLKSLVTTQKYTNEVGEQIKISMKDAGIEVFDLEFREGVANGKFKVSKGFYQNIQNLAKVIFTPLGAFDFVGKSSLFRSTQMAWSKMAQKNPKRLRRILMNKFQDAEFVDKVIKDIKNNKASKDSKLAFYMQMTEFHPITTSDHIKFYVDHPVLRSFLVLSSFAFKIIDRFARQGTELLLDGMQELIIGAKFNDKEGRKTAGMKIGAGVVGSFQVLVLTFALEASLRSTVKRIYNNLGITLRPQDEEEEKEQSIWYQYRLSLLEMNPFMSVYGIRKFLQTGQPMDFVNNQFNLPEVFGSGIIESIVKGLQEDGTWTDDAWMKDIPIAGDFMYGKSQKEKYNREQGLQVNNPSSLLIDEKRREFDLIDDLLLD